jgi:hypothetical protein
LLLPWQSPRLIFCPSLPMASPRYPPVQALEIQRPREI